jgi:hypothetical protein
MPYSWLRSPHFASMSLTSSFLGGAEGGEQSIALPYPCWGIQKKRRLECGCGVPPDHLLPWMEGWGTPVTIHWKASGWNKVGVEKWHFSYCTSCSHWLLGNVYRFLGSRNQNPMHFLATGDTDCVRDISNDANSLYYVFYGYYVHVLMVRLSSSV